MGNPCPATGNEKTNAFVSPRSRADTETRPFPKKTILFEVIVIMHWNGRTRVPFRIVVLAAGLFLLASGCGDNTGTVSGTVRCGGQPLSEGSVSFLTEQGQAATGTIDRSGNYIVKRVPLGPAKVTVQIFSAEGPPPLTFGGVPKTQGTPGADGKKPKIPPRYSLADRSGLRHNVMVGKQQFDIDLQE
jgi:hypothetical protein